LSPAFPHSEFLGTLPTSRLLDALASYLGYKLDWLPTIQEAREQLSFFQIGDCLWAILAALLGGLLAVAFFGGATDRSAKANCEPQPAAMSLAMTWKRPAIIGLGGLALVSFLAAVGWGLSPKLGSSAAFMLTSALIGLAGLGAALSRGRRREICLGSSFFGAGFMILAFGQPTWILYGLEYPPTTEFLNALRIAVRPIVSGSVVDPDRDASANARIWKRLEQPVPMRFPLETPLEDVLKYIQDATRDRDGDRIPIYIDPIGLQEAEKSLTSTLQIDLEGAPLRTSLRICLEQIGLRYDVGDGLLYITSAFEPVPSDLDSFEVVGLCFLAFLAAGLGGVLAPLVSDLRRGPGD
jgi:hypothetical protein